MRLNFKFYLIFFMQKVILLLVASLFYFGSMNAQFLDADINEVLTGKVCDSTVMRSLEDTTWIVEGYQVIKLDNKGYLKSLRALDSTGKEFVSVGFKRNSENLAIEQNTVVDMGFLSFKSNTFSVYDADKNIVRSVSIDMNPLTMTWDSSNRSTYTYDANKYLTERFDESFENDEWIKSERVTYRNSSKGLAETMLTESWVDFDSSWQPNSRITYTYNSNNEVKTEIEERNSYIDGKLEWLKNSMYEYIYNSLGMPIVTTSKIWNDSDNVWENDYIDSVKGNKTLTYTWYDEEWQLTSVQDCVTGMPSNIKSDAKINREKLSLYPNPATQKVILNTQGLSGNYTLEITNILGKRVSIESVNNPSNHYEVNVSNLTPGLYYITLQNRNSIFTAPVVITK